MYIENFESLMNIQMRDGTYYCILFFVFRNLLNTIGFTSDKFSFDLDYRDSLHYRRYHIHYVSVSTNQGTVQYVHGHIQLYIIYI